MGKNVLVRLFAFAIFISLFSTFQLTSATAKETGRNGTAIKPTTATAKEAGRNGTAIKLTTATAKEAMDMNSAVKLTLAPMLLEDGSKIGFLSVEFLGLPQIKPRYLRKAEREAARTERVRKRAYNDAIRENQRRSIEIQTPEVQERMKMNKKNADASFRAKRKENRARSRDAARKFN